jgi:hypothetical protein
LKAAEEEYSMNECMADAILIYLSMTRDPILREMKKAIKKEIK